MKGKKNTLSGNYLDFVPVRSEAYRYETDPAGAVIIFVENKGVFHRIAQVFFHRPRVSQIHLDEMGSFVWPLMDGSRSVGEIAQLVKAEFGDRAEPLYNRLVQYVRNLESYGFAEVKPR